MDDTEKYEDGFTEGYKAGFKAACDKAIEFYEINMYTSSFIDQFKKYVDYDKQQK